MGAMTFHVLCHRTRHEQKSYTDSIEHNISPHPTTYPSLFVEMTFRFSYPELKLQHVSTCGYECLQLSTTVKPET
jgi:hypothetical protein